MVKCCDVTYDVGWIFVVVVSGGPFSFIPAKQVDLITTRRIDWLITNNLAHRVLIIIIPISRKWSKLLPFLVSPHNKSHIS